MPEWVWMLCVFLALSMGYLAGFMGGSWKSESETDIPPTENAYIRETEINAELIKTVEMRKLELEAQKWVYAYDQEHKQEAKS